MDVTRKRQLERELQRSQRLELIGRLASGVAHDFNNLLTVVLSLTRAGAAQPAGATTRSTRTCAASPRRASRRPAWPASCWPSASSGTGTPRPVDVNRVVGRTLELLRATLPGRHRAGVGPGGARAVRPGGRDAAAAGADEPVPQRPRRHAARRPADGCGPAGASGGREVRLTVQDTGHGHERGGAARIFEPFFSTKENGTGLGLAVVQQIVESYGGASRWAAGRERGRGSTSGYRVFREWTQTNKKRPTGVTVICWQRRDERLPCQILIPRLAGPVNLSSTSLPGTIRLLAENPIPCEGMDVWQARRSGLPWNRATT